MDKKPSRMLPAISKLLPHLPRVFRSKVQGKPALSEQIAASDIVNSSSGKHLSVRIILLDDSELILYFKSNSKARTLLEQVFEHVGIIEKEYFGLCLRDDARRKQWIDLQKTLGSQLNGKVSAILYFAVKFYAADPCKLFQEITRYQFFLQVKKDILEGRLPVSNHIAAELAACVIQSELGDYNPVQHSPGYSSEFDFIPNQTEKFERRVEELHRRLVGLVPARAEYNFLDKVKWLEMYGVDLHPVQGEGAVDYFLGIAPTGIVIYRNKVRVGNHFWPRMVKISCKGSLLVLRVRDKDSAEKTYTFNCVTKQACKQLEQCCVEHHQFFRTNAASYSYQTTIKLFAADARRRSSSSEPNGEQETPTFTRRSSRRQRNPRRTSCSGNVITDRPHNTRTTPYDSHRCRCAVLPAPDGLMQVLTLDVRLHENASDSDRFKQRKRVLSKRLLIRIPSSGPRHRRKCCTDDMSDVESQVSFASSRRPRWSENTIVNDSDCESVYSCCHNKSLRYSRRSRGWDDYDCCDMDSQSLAGSCLRRRFHGSVTSMVSAPDPSSHRRARHSRHRRRLPPEELAQHFRYEDHTEMGFANERLQLLPYTHVETNADESELKVSPRTWQRLRQRHRKIYGTHQHVTSSRQAWLPESTIPEMPVDAQKSHQSVPRFNSSFQTREVPSQYLQLPVSVQKTEMFTAPIVKIKRTDGTSSAPLEEKCLNRLSMSSSSSAGTTDMYDIRQVSCSLAHSRIEHC